MANGIRRGDPRGFNKGRSSKFREGSRFRQTLEEGWRTYQPKRSGNINKDEDNTPNTPNNKNSLAFFKELEKQKKSLNSKPNKSTGEIFFLY